MNIYLKIFLIIFILKFSKADDSYLPCQSWITFGIDDSNTLNSHDFKNQLSFISSAIGALNYPERIQIGSAYNQSKPWKSEPSIQELQSFVESVTQFGPYDLLLQFSDIVSNLPKIEPTPFPIAAVIFISNTSNAALLGAHFLKPDLSNVRITFVLLGNSADESKLRNFTSNFITWKNLSLPQPENWNNEVAAKAYGCHSFSWTTSSALSTTTVSRITVPTSVTTSTQTSPQTSTTLPSISGTTTEPYKPCQSWISFSYDDSVTMQGDNFRNQISFISQAIGDLNYPDRLRVNGAFTGVASFNSYQTISQMQSELNSIQPTQNTYSLLLEFAGIKTDLESLGTQNWPIGALIFISDTSDAALANANHFFPLKSGVKITFVMLGTNVDATKLVQFSHNFIFWTNLSQPQPDNWDRLSYISYGCNNTFPQQPTSTGSTFSLPSTTFSPSVIHSTQVVTTHSTPIPYLPCQSWISFSYEDSLTLSNADFKTQTAFIANALTPITYPDRIRVSGNYIGVASWNSHITIAQMQNETIAAQQTQNSYSLLLEFANLLTDLEALGNTLGLSIGALIFISDTSDSALANANNFYNQLVNASVRITFVMLGSNVDSTKLTQFSSNFINWSDLSQPQPDNWDNLFFAAYECNVTTFTH